MTKQHIWKKKCLHWTTALGLVLQQVPMAAYGMDFDQNQSRTNRTSMPKKLDENITYENFLTHLEEAQKKIQHLKDKDLTLLIGGTGVGKSTLINFMAGKKLKGTRNEEFNWEIGGENLVAAIGHKETSETLIPNVWESTQKEKFYVDCPGFFDTRGPATDILKAFLMKKLIDEAKSTKIVLVMTQGKTQEVRNYEAKALENQINSLHPGVKSNASVIVTKAEEDYQEAHALNALRKAFPSLSKTKIFYRPNKDGELIGKPQDFLNFIQSTPSLEKSAGKAGVALSPESALEINKSFKKINETTIPNLMKNISSEIQNAYAKKLHSDYDIDLDKWYQDFDTMLGKGKDNKEPARENPGKFADFLENELKTLKIQEDKIKNYLSEIKKIGELGDFFKSVLPKNTYSPDVWINCLDSTKNALNQLKNICGSIKFTQVGNHLICDGYFPKTSELINKIRDYNGISAIQINAFHTLCFDADISGEKFQGVNLSIIAPKWAIKKNVNICLTGKDGSSHPVATTTGVAGLTGQPGENGANGLPGNPGYNSGHFFGIKDTSHDGGQLSFTLNGGTGGKGQKGETGGEGGDGHNATTLDIPNAIGAWHDWPGDRLLEENYTGATNPGAVGAQGGLGGQGGAGGKGGKPGKAETIGLNVPIVTKNGSVGARGADGETGIHGLSGRQGRNRTGIYHRRQIHPGSYSLLVNPLVGGITLAIAQKDQRWEWSSGPALVDNFGPRGPARTEIITTKNHAGIKDPVETPMNYAKVLNDYRKSLVERKAALGQNPNNVLMKTQAELLQTFSNKLEANAEVKKKVTS